MQLAGDQNGNGNARLWAFVQTALFVAIGAIGSLVLLGLSNLDHGVATRFGIVDRDIAALSQRLADMDAKINAINVTAAVLDQRVDGLRTDLDRTREWRESTAKQLSDLMGWATEELAKLRIEIEAKQQK